MLNGGPWQRREIGNISQQIKSDHQERAERQGERNITPRVSYFAGNERDVVPGIGGEQRLRLRDANTDEQSKRCRRSKPWAYFAQVTTQRPKIAKVCRPGAG